MTAKASGRSLSDFFSYLAPLFFLFSLVLKGPFRNSVHPATFLLACALKCACAPLLTWQSGAAAAHIQKSCIKCLKRNFRDRERTQIVVPISPCFLGRCSKSFIYIYLFLLISLSCRVYVYACACGCAAFFFSFYLTLGYTGAQLLCILSSLFLFVLK